LARDENGPANAGPFFELKDLAGVAIEASPALGFPSWAARGVMKVKVLTDGFEGHVRRSLESAQKIARGERLEPEKIITFGDPMMMFELMTVQRMRLFQTARKKKLSISALAEELGRNRGSVTRDVNKLKQFGLIRLREQVNPGHGVVQIVEPVAKKIEMRAEL
jgi:predicted transcriptional regulator